MNGFAPIEDAVTFRDARCVRIEKHQELFGTCTQVDFYKLRRFLEAFLDGIYGILGLHIHKIHIFGVIAGRPY